MDARKTPLLLLVLCALLLGACDVPGGAAGVASTPVIVASPPTTTPTSPAPTTAITPTPVSLTVALAEGVPAQLRRDLRLPVGMRIVNENRRANLTLDVLPDTADQPAIYWVYALVAPFPTIPDEVEWSELRAVWQGRTGQVVKSAPLLLDATTRAAFERLWGPAHPARVRVVDADELLEQAWAGLPSWAIVPFEDLDPRWKVLRVADESPLERDFDPAGYRLALRFGLTGETPSTAALEPASNRDPSRLTILVMTGTTALAREIAEKMEEKGIKYPAHDIGEMMRAADLTHISNEVSFYKDCPAPVKRPPNFCSHPDYIELLETIGTDIVELTGNHLLDWGPAPFLETLKAYRQKRWLVYGGGENLSAARAALTLEDHGNRLAFIGCNASGPESDWATEKTPGSASCDFESMAARTRELAGQGYLVIATFQHVEVCRMEPHLAQQADFGKLVQAGAVIVSGSQAHCPQGMAFKGNQFVHYGLGNLFFDQMDNFSRQQFIDRHIFYDGRYISTELVTTRLEDYARPRKMTSAERAKLLEDAFRASGWIK